MTAKGFAPDKFRTDLIRIPKTVRVADVLSNERDSSRLANFTDRYSVYRKAIVTFIQPKSMGCSLAFIAVRSGDNLPVEFEQVTNFHTQY